MYSADAGRSTYGHSIGVIMQHDGLVRLPGDVGNLSTYSFPVTFRVVRDAPIDEIQHLTVLDHAAGFIEAAKDLEAMGCKAITTGCGFLALLQPVLAAAVTVPVFASPLIQVPLVKAMLPPDRVVGIITAGAKNLSEEHFNAVGWSARQVPVCVVGIDEEPGCAFSRETLNQVGTDPSLIPALESSMIDLARRLVEREPAVGAIVLECTNMPPFADAVQRAVNLPVFDAVTLINMVHEAVTRRPYQGYL